MIDALAPLHLNGIDAYTTVYSYQGIGPDSFESTADYTTVEFYLMADGDGYIVSTTAPSELWNRTDGLAGIAKTFSLAPNAQCAGETPNVGSSTAPEGMPTVGAIQGDWLDQGRMEVRNIASSASLNYRCRGGELVAAKEGGELWSYALPTPYFDCPAVANGDFVYIYAPLPQRDGSGGNTPSLVALDSTGTEIWVIDQLGSWDSRRPVIVTPNTVYAVTGASVLSVDASTGVVNWEARLEGSGRAPVLIADLTIVPDVAGFVHGIDQETGALRWKRRLLGPFVEHHADGSTTYSNALADAHLHHGTAVIGQRDGTLVALDGEANTVWSVQLGGFPGSGAARFESAGRAMVVGAAGTAYEITVP